MKKALMALAFLGGTSLFASTHVYVGVGANAPVYVAAPPCPGPGYAWVQGYWVNGPQRYWHAGYWSAPAPRRYESSSWREPRREERFDRHEHFRDGR